MLSWSSPRNCATACVLPHITRDASVLSLVSPRKSSHARHFVSLKAVTGNAGFFCLPDPNMDHDLHRTLLRPQPTYTSSAPESTNSYNTVSRTLHLSACVLTPLPAVFLQDTKLVHPIQGSPEVPSRDNPQTMRDKRLEKYSSFPDSRWDNSEVYSIPRFSPFGTEPQLPTVEPPHLNTFGGFLPSLLLSLHPHLCCLGSPPK